MINQINAVQMHEQFNIATNLHKFLYKEIYSNFDNVRDLMDLISKRFNLFNIEFCPTNYSIKLKIKKTDMKKSSNYTCTPEYYYGIFNSIMCDFFKTKYSYIQLKSQNAYLYDLQGTEYYEYLINETNVSLIYSIAIISDNIINIFL